jgi:fluoride exporter
MTTERHDTTESNGAPAQGVLKPRTWAVLAAVYAGGVLGVLVRAGVTEAFPHEAGTWPWPTFAINVAGSAILGLVAVRYARSPVRPLVGTGFCGALTTFSAMQLELLQLLDAGRVALALLYAAASVAAGLAAVRIAWRVA